MKSGKTGITVSFQNEQAVFVPGQEVSGHVYIQVNENYLKIRNVRLKIKGESSVRWTESSGTGDDRKTDTYSNYEIYYNHKVILHSFGNEPEGFLPFGQHQFQFRFQLPYQIPSSVEEQHGNVKHYVAVKIDKPLAIDYTVSVPFTVINPFDVSMRPALLEPVVESATRTPGLLCCKRGPVTITMHLPKASFIPGERVPVNIQVDNNSGKRFSKAKIYVIRNITFHATSKSKHNSTELAKHHVMDANGEVLPSVEIIIPQCSPTSELDHCKIMTLSHEMKLYVSLKGPHLPISVHVPVEIRLASSNSQFQPESVGNQFQPVGAQGFFSQEYGLPPPYNVF